MDDRSATKRQPTSATITYNDDPGRCEKLGLVIRLRGTGLYFAPEAGDFEAPEFDEPYGDTRYQISPSERRLTSKASEYEFAIPPMPRLPISLDCFVVSQEWPDDPVPCSCDIDQHGGEVGAAGTQDVALDPSTMAAAKGMMANLESLAASNAAIREMLEGAVKVNPARIVVNQADDEGEKGASMVERKPRYKPPDCTCGGKTKVSSSGKSGKSARTLKCLVCGRTWAVARND